MVKRVAQREVGAGSVCLNRQMKTLETQVVLILNH